MRKQLLNLKFLLMLCMIFVIGGRSVAFAEETTVTIFNETFGSTSSNTDFDKYKSFSATTEMFTEGTASSNYSGDGKVGKSAVYPSSGYTGASGKSAAWQTGTANSTSTVIQIDKINIKDFSNIKLSFGAWLNNTAHSFAVKYSIDGGKYTDLSLDYTTANQKWTLVTTSISGTGKSLSLMFTHTPTKGWTIRVDDILLTGTKKTVSTDPSSELTLSQTTGEVNVDKTLDIHSYVSKADGYTGTVTYAVTTGAEYASVSEAGVITGLAEGIATVKVTAPAIGGSFSESSAEFTVTVVENRTATTVTFDPEVDDKTFNVNPGETFVGKTATVSPTEAGSVTYSSDNTDVATVNENTGAITIGNTAGTATITAFFAATDDYKASSAKYYINVIDPNGPVFYESFNQNKGTGGNNGIWNNISKKPTLICDNSGWTDKNVSGADKCAIFGTSSAKGTATTPAINLSGGKYILTFKAGAWNAKDEKTAIDVVISDGELTYNGKSLRTQTIEMNKGAWTDYTMTIAGATNNATITFTAKYDKNNRFFLDEVKIVKVQAPEPTTSGDLTFKAQDSDGMYYATFSSDKDVVFTKDVIVSAVSVADNKLSITNLTTGYYEVTDATVGEETGIVQDGYYVPKNNGVLISCTDASAKYYFPKTEQTTVTLSANQLKPAPAEGGEFNAEAGYKYYKLAYDDYDAKTGLGFYRGEANGGVFSVKAGTAYLAVPPTSGSAVKGFSFDGASTGVSAVDAEEPAKTRVIYNIAGQKVNAMTKAGLYIVNGKKIVIRK